MPFADIALARRLEMMDAYGEILYCRTHAELFPEAGATFESFAGGIAAYAGSNSPMSQAFAMGLNGVVTEKEIERLEDFFYSRGSVVSIEVCPLADDSLVRILNTRGYVVSEFSNVLVRNLGSDLGSYRAAGRVRIFEAKPAEFYIWTETVARGFADDKEVLPEMRDIALVFFHEPGVRHVLVEVDGVVAGGGAMGINEGIADIFGTSTLRDFRGRGVQSSLIRALLETARDEGCEIATATTQCGSTSQRNFERQGFRVAYTRSKFVATG